MARRLRIDFAGGVHHVTSRGDRREDIYRDKTDRNIWFKLFGDVCRKYCWVCHSFCLMNNHYHLILETKEATLSKGMHRLNSVYAQSFNRRHSLVGHLFQGRFKSILVEKDSYLLELVRYVALNPVRVQASTQAEEWPWSSFRHLVGVDPAPEWLETNWVLQQFHRDRGRAIELLIDFVRSDGGLTDFWEDLRQGIVLGSEAFWGDVCRKYDIPINSGPTAIAGGAVDVKSLQEYALEFKTRRTAMVEAYRSGVYTLKEIAAYFAVHHSTVSRAVRASGIR